jgi:hypothetical protein
MLFRRGKEVGRFRIRCPISTVLGDNLSQNKLCAKIHNTHPSCPRMSRCCLTPHFECDTLPHKCHLVDGVLIRKLSLDAIGCLHLFDAEAGVDDESANMQPMLRVNLDSFIEWWRGLDPTKRSLGMELYQKRVDLAANILQDVYGSHAVHNAFARADFGANSDIHQATMADLMHAMEEGIFVWVTSNLIGVLSNKHKERLDGLVDLMFCQFGNNRSGERPNYPRVNFTRGFSKLTLLTCDERVGILFVVALLLNTRRGREILQVRFEPEFDLDHERATNRNRSQAQDPPPNKGAKKQTPRATARLLLEGSRWQAAREVGVHWTPPSNAVPVQPTLGGQGQR